MSNEAITSILARSLLDADFLHRLRQDPHGALAEYGLDPSTLEELGELDVDRLADLSGFITKVKHNHLWEAFPYTRILLRMLGLELAAFRAYTANHQKLRKEGKVPRREGIRRFVEFLDSHLAERSGPECEVLRDLLSHERLRWEISRELGNEPAESKSSTNRERDLSRLNESALLKVVPTLRSTARVCRFRHDPLEILSLLRERRLQPDRLAPRERWLAYVGDPESLELNIFELEPASAILLSCVDGRRAVCEVLREAGDFEPRIGRLAPNELGSFLEVAHRQGLIAVPPR